MIEYAKNCSFQGAGSYLAELLFYNEFEDYEKAFAVVSENNVIGFAALLKECSCNDNERHAPWLDFLFVDEKYRNQHIGIALIDAVCCYAKKLEFNDIFLCTVSQKTCNCSEPFAKCCCAAYILRMFGSRQMNLCGKRLMKASFQRRFPINSLGSEQLQKLL